MSQAALTTSSGGGGGGITSITGDSGGAQSGPAITLVGDTDQFAVAGAANTLTISYTDPTVANNLRVITVLNTINIQPESGQGLQINLQDAADTFTVKDSASGVWLDVEPNSSFVAIAKNQNSQTYVNGNLNTVSGDVYINSSDDSVINLYPSVFLTRGTSATANADQVSDILSLGLDSALAGQQYGDISCYCVSNVAGSATGKMTLGVALNSTIVTKITILSTGCQVQGNNANTAPPSGSLGEQLIGTVAKGSPQSLSNNTPANVVTLALTAGTWDVSAVVSFTGTAAAPTSFIGSVGLTSATLGTLGDNAVTIQASSLVVSDTSVTIPSWRVTTAGANVYMVAQAAFPAGTVSAYGRLSATRVG